jgi:tetratricopeptide (TPR) repeat protein
MLVAQLAGIGSSIISAEAIPVLTEYLPVDSLDHYFYTKPAWMIGWSAGAYHATFGDTTLVPAYQQALEALPGGGTSKDYRAALSGDIESRLAVRRGDLDTALEEARNAYENWLIHSNNASPGWSEYSLRFHLAEVLDAGRIEETRGNREEALQHYLRAVRLWERGDPEVVGQWLARAQEGLSRLQSELVGP